MKQGLHPEVHEVTANCTCGFSFETTSTVQEIRVTICSHCHPFFTGAQKFVDTAGRIEKFEQRYKKPAQPVKVVKTAAEKPAAKTKKKK